MSQRLAVSIAALLTCATAAVAQNRPRNLLPSDEVAARYGLVRKWYGFAPVDGVRERVQSVTAIGDQLHVQTNASQIHALDAESGKLLWSAQLGIPIPGQFGSAITSKSVFALNGSKLYRLNRQDGSQLWSVRLPQAPNAAPAADEERVLVSTADGRIYVYNTDTHTVNWFYQTNAAVSMPATLLDDKIACASEDGMMYVFQTSSRNPTIRFKTDAPISAPMAAWGRTVLVPSRDFNLYSVDVRSGETLWRYSCGGEIRRPVTVIENDAYVAPDGLGMHALRAESGERKWLNPRAADFVVASKNRVYAADKLGQLLILDRANGRLLATWDTHNFDWRVRNEVNDRLYLVTTSGLVVCLHEKANKDPVEHRKVLPPPPAAAEAGKP